ncbi:hypothetical protein BGX27_004196, partial [Mortierella sp. AM989]
MKRSAAEKLETPNTRRIRITSNQAIGLGGFVNATVAEEEEIADDKLCQRSCRCHLLERLVLCQKRSTVSETSCGKWVFHGGNVATGVVGPMCSGIEAWDDFAYLRNQAKPPG